MNSAAFFLLLLSHQGHWLAGHEATITIDPYDQVKSPVFFNWVLGREEVSIASGRVKLKNNEKPKQIRIKVPDVRVLTDMRLAYRVEKEGGEILQSGENAVVVYPDNLLAGLAEHLQDKQIIVLDKVDRLPALLKKADIEHLQIDDESQLTLKYPDIILVGADQLSDRPFGQDALLGQVRGGARVFSFAQTRVTKLANHELVERKTLDHLTWNAQSDLVRHVRNRQPINSERGIYPLRMSADTAKGRMAFWPKEHARSEFEVMMGTHSIGKGQWVFCQFFWGNFQSNPRNQLFLADVLRFMSVDEKAK